MTTLLMSSVQYDKALSKFGQQRLVMLNYACGFNRSEMGKYFERIIKIFVDQIWKELCHTEPLASKGQPSADY